MTIKREGIYCGRPKITHTCDFLDEDADVIQRTWNPWRGKGGEYDEWQYVLSTGCSQDEHYFNIKFCPYCGANLIEEERQG